MSDSDLGTSVDGSKGKEDVVINVSGMRFEIPREALLKYPDTLLGDPLRLQLFFDPSRNEYFFNRNRPSFDAIYQFYTFGDELRRPFNVSIDVFMKEIEFFDLNVFFFQGLQKLEEYPGKSLEIVLPENRFQRRLWLFIQYPESSAAARAYDLVSAVAVVVLISVLCLQSLPEWKYYQIQNVSNSGFIEDIVECPMPSLWDIGFLLESFCMMWFTNDIILRFLACPKKLFFFFSPTNILDLTVIVPYVIYIPEILSGECDIPPRMNIAFFNVIRTAEALILFKFYEHSQIFKTLVFVIKSSLREIDLILFYTLIGALLFSTAIYFLEGDIDDSPFYSIPHSCWWAVITMTMVGYGDMIPVSVWGKVVGALCALTGPVSLALILPSIVNQFNLQLKRTQYDSYRHNMVKRFSKLIYKSQLVNEIEENPDEESEITEKSYELSNENTMEESEVTEMSNEIRKENLVEKRGILRRAMVINKKSPNREIERN